MEILLENITLNRNHSCIRKTKSNSKHKSFHLSKAKNNASKNLPHELVIEILSWLPIKFLSPLRFVCKSWFNLLTTDLNFSKLHFDRSIKCNCNPSILWLPQQQTNLHQEIGLKFQQRIHFFYDSSDGEKEVVHDIEFPFYKLDFSNFTVYGICNGMVCGSCTGKNEIFIWNPFTKDGISIPYSPTPSRFLGYSKMTSFGFGFRQDTQEYKVIKVFHESDFRASDHHLHVSVCTLGVDSLWRDLKLKDDIPCIMGLGNPLVNGVLHWLGIRSGLFSISTIVAFDLKDEVFEEMSLPNGVDFGGSSISVKLGELGGLLCLFCGIGVEIWAMNEYGVSNSWTKNMKIGRPTVGGSFVYLEPLGFVARTGEIIVQKNLVELIIYDPKTSSVRTLGELGCPFSNAYFTFIPSIISPTAFSVSGHIIRLRLLGGRSILEDQSSVDEILDAPHASSSHTLVLDAPQASTSRSHTLMSLRSRFELLCKKGNKVKKINPPMKKSFMLHNPHASNSSSHTFDVVEIAVPTPM